MAKKKDLFSIKDSELAQWFSIELQKLDEIVDFFDSDPDDDWNLVEDKDYKYVNKTQKIRVFSTKGALKIATYLDQNVKKGLWEIFIEILTQHKKKLKESFAKKIIIEELVDSSSIIVHNGYPMIYKQSLRRILETNGWKLNQTFNDIQKSHQLSAHDAEQIDDYLHQKHRPTVVVMNPPFSASPRMAKRNQFATLKHLSSALARLSQGGRLVAITANWFSPLSHEWRDSFVKLQNSAKFAFSCGIAGNAYAKHGTTIETRLTVFDKIAAENPGEFANCFDAALFLPDLLNYVESA